MIDRKIIATPTTHYGAPKRATRTFIHQRISGALNVLFLVFFIWLVIRLAGAGRAEMVGVIANPFVAVVLALLLVSVTYHMRIGMGEVIEDYLDKERTHRLGMTLNTAFSVAIALIGLVSVAKIAFWG
ncbi:succinate dehydrogenase, hydrophobic membrane anchor protein [Devosia sp.]|uniref:succinate dehydrogenase, hydrophobic membrane anchor protein n=1 Tax=Devosia sp. TaxID=1871048 RepID=UPI002EEA15C9